MIPLPSPKVSVDWLLKQLDDPNLIILDATIKKVTSEETANNPGLQIKGARFFDIKKSFSETNTNLPNMVPSAQEFEIACRSLGICSHHKIIIYDTHGIYSSPRAWWMFTIMGHKNVAILDGGLPAWMKQALPTETKPKNPLHYKKGDFKAIYNSAMVVDLAKMLSETNASDSIILDARSHGRFYGTAPEPRNDLKSGHIPNSFSLPYTRLLHNGHLLPKEKLNEIFDDFDIENKRLIFSCGSGITACIILVAAHMCGYKKLQVYDGSWSEWGQIDGIPIEC
ncbi:3-mercaptopyruvate sulfurtransferase [Aquimarina addita]|uniref:3-mercaptopyruvate sulfurtransferase n=1 Tax=Aquimarina addita TaxID=870485 RepID=A0ABP7XCG7_9FLAO